MFYNDYNKLITEHFDITDRETRKTMLSINESDQVNVLTNLTSKLYDNIINKVDKIDMGEIPGTKGDITKLDNYEKIVECIDVMKNILDEYKQDKESVLIIDRALENIKLRKELFEKSFRYDIELPITFYNTMTLSVVTSLSLLISTCIEFIKSPKEDNFETSLDRVSEATAKQHLLFTNLHKFNESCKCGEFNKAMNFIIDGRTKKLSGVTMIASVALVAMLLNVVPILRELIFFFYYSRTKISDYFEVQADLLQIGAYNLDSTAKNKSKEEKKKIYTKQMKLVEKFRKFSSFFAIDSKKSEKDATKEIVASNKKQKITDVVDTMPDSAKIDKESIF